MRLWLACVAATALWGGTVARTQGPPPPPAGGLIIGRAVDGTTERPVSNIVVTLAQMGAGGPSASPGLPGLPGARGGGSAPQPPRVVTDSAGRFVFTGVAPGRYSVQVATLSGVLFGGYGMRRPSGPTQPLEVAADARLNDVIVRVWRPASISGTVTDQFGDPVVETRVTALRVTIVGGARRLTASRTTITDDRGVFHLSRLEPGEYSIYLPFPEVTVPKSVQAAYDTSSSGGQVGREQFRVSIGESGAPDLNNDGFHIGDFVLVRGSNMYGSDGAMGPMLTTPAPDEAGSVLVYPLTLFPGVTSLPDAATFVLESGQERAGTDLQVRLVPSAAISGRVVGPEGGVSMVAVRLIAPGATDAANENILEAASTMTDANGAFTFLGVPAGQYTLKVTRVPITARPQTMTSISVGGTTMFTAGPESDLPPLPLPDTPTLTAALPVTVGNRDISDLLVTLRAGPRVSGRLQYEGSGTPLTSDQLLRATIQLEPVDGRTAVGSTGRGQFDAAGRFTTLGLIAGQYVLRVGGNLGAWSLASAMAGGRDIADALLAIETSDVSDVVITMTDRPSSLTGSVRSQAGADPNAVVLAFPVDRTGWANTGVTLRRLRAGRVSARGVFAIEMLPPGDYFVVAIDDKAGENWQDPKRLEMFSRAATRVTVQPGERHSVDLATEVVR